MGPLLKLLPFVVLLGGCSDYSVTKIETDNPAPPEDPEILVDPTLINFGTINADGDTVTETVTITNGGTDTLNITSIQLDIATSAFTVSSLLGNDVLEPDETATFTVTYDPETYETNSNSVYIVSNDYDTPTVPVTLLGDGSAPVISIEPDTFDFESVLVGCEESLDVTVTNIGDVELIIDQIDYFVTYPTDFAIEDYEDVYGVLPWILSPGDTVVLQVYYYPTDIDTDAGVIEIQSNDPQTPIAIADQVADGAYSSTYEETFEQDEIDAVDILFVVDNLCSMNDKQTQLSTNFVTFMNVLDLSGVDYHIGFITTDSSDAVGSLITTTTTDPVTEVATIIDSIGTHGSANEKGLHYSYYALQSGYDFGPGSDFWRTDAKLIIIYISDEDDHSSGITPTSIKTYTVSAKGSEDYVTAHAVAGDYPGGCTTNGGAEAGTEYYTVVSYLNGVFLSICEDDWGTPLETLANESILKSSFVLSQSPVEQSISVTVDGVDSTDWVYDSSDNSIDFDSTAIPVAGASVYVSYALIYDCPEEKDTGT
jgi:hypothetical protein